MYAHPMHLGLALLSVAVAMMWGSIPVILASGWGVAAAFWFVLMIEEKETLQRFGDEYSRYMQRTPPFVLSPKCLRKGYNTVKRGKQNGSNSMVKQKARQRKDFVSSMCTGV
ncbi:MAG: hypothetical protein JRI77_10310 [Deltaproteobacteria bacterium]|nr:hypothetical protein [Deltaproteobacteria bacterium]